MIRKSARLLPPDIFDDTQSNKYQQKEISFENIWEVYNYSQGRFILLGEPGSGKTITLLSMARDAAINHLNDSTNPIPVLANISSWDGDQDLSDWLKSQVDGVKFHSNEILYILDSLDEIPKWSDDSNRFRLHKKIH